MIILFAAVALATPSMGHPSLPGSDFLALSKSARQLCPDKAIAHLSPAGLLDIEERYEDRLDPLDRSRLNAHLGLSPDGGVKECRNLNGATCSAQVYLRAIRQTGLQKAFHAYVCDTATDDDVLPRSFW